jgi:hypothetical protein
MSNLREILEFTRGIPRHSEGPDTHCHWYQEQKIPPVSLPGHEKHMNKYRYFSQRAIEHAITTKDQKIGSLKPICYAPL